MERVNKIGGKIELTDKECEKLYEHGEIFIISYRTIWQLKYSENGGWYAPQVYYHDKYKHYLPLTKAGRFVAYNGKNANDLLGWKLFIEE